jgi:hypothetical protein
MRFVRGLLAVLAAVVLAGCVRSTTDAFADMTPATPLPAEFVAAGSEGVFHVRLKGDTYRFIDNDDLQYVRLFLEAEGRTRHFLQVVAKEDPSSYFYAMSNIGGGMMNVATVPHGRVAEEFGIGGTIEDDGKTVLLDDAEAILNLLRMGEGVANRTVAQFDIYDFADPAQREAGMALLAQQ